MGSNSKIETESPIVFYDGVCNFCNSSVNFIIRHEREAVLKFASLQSELGQSTLSEFGRNSNDYDSILLLKDGKLFEKSEAAFEITDFLKTPWNWLGVLGILPTSLNNFFYDVIANYRYKIFGKSESCAIPNQDVRKRFLDQEDTFVVSG